MRSDKYLWNICMEIYIKMYNEADPPLDFKKALDAGYCGKENWFINHYLPMERAKEIVDEAFKKYKCDKYERKKINFEIWLGSAPSGIKKDGDV